ncbi:MAG: hypothetical protein OMM_09286 [Candidatus Magnetoglobus multicellularis str. Araruama]|uniref:Uncharacterized protein n=1 Tax=Candidatus Magnetoglobus multicellularis str. Araruama TaxID=890399 RepID=A0A1V1P4H0_9BACT|nr:MAG: hypothetical protein OMM_09286 [Candidatus Magnetoglobus multicellularis str. Araruama]
MEDEAHSGYLDLTWYYDDSEYPDKAEKDKNNDQQADIWFYYQEGKIVSVEEDTNFDGKPDIWEEYDASEALVLRSKDINFDGIADITYPDSSNNNAKQEGDNE